MLKVPCDVNEEYSEINSNGQVAYPFRMNPPTQQQPMYPQYNFPQMFSTYPNQQNPSPIPPQIVFNQQQFAVIASGMNLENAYSPNSPLIDQNPESDCFTRLDGECRKRLYDKVSGRLCLLSGTKKYSVSIGEIYRRICPPETLHASLINSILRNAKAKDNGNKLRSNLMNYGIELPQGRRKTSKTTCFTAFCEGEALQLGEDFTQLMLCRGSSCDIGKEYISRLMSYGKSPQQIKMELDAVCDFMKFIIEIHPEDKEPDDLRFDTTTQKAVTNLSLLTHGFSHIAINGVAKFMKDMVSSRLPFKMDGHGMAQTPTGFFPHPNAPEH